MHLGIHRDMPGPAYHSIRAASATYLRHLLQSPAHAMQAMTTPKDPTPEMVFGSACHLAILQPDLLSTEFVVADQCCAITGKGQQCSRLGSIRIGSHWFCQQHDQSKGTSGFSANVLSAEDMDRVLLIADSVRAHPAAKELLDARTETELSALWKDSESGVVCKMRADFLVDSGCIVGDLKTTADASPDGFASSLWNFDYPIQSAHYLRGLSHCGHVYDTFHFIAVEKVPPFCVACYSLPTNIVLGALDDLDMLLQIWKACEAGDGAGWRRGYGDGIIEAQLPDWTQRKRDERLQRLQEQLNSLTLKVVG